MYGPQEHDRSLLGRQVVIQTAYGDAEQAIVVRTTASGMMKVQTEMGDFLWGNQWEDAPEFEAEVA